MIWVYTPHTLGPGLCRSSVMGFVQFVWELCKVLSQQPPCFSKRLVPTDVSCEDWRMLTLTEPHLWLWVTLPMVLWHVPKPTVGCRKSSMAGNSLLTPPCRDVCAITVRPLLRSSVARVRLKRFQSFVTELKANQILYCSKKVRFCQSNLTTFHIELK